MDRSKWEYKPFEDCIEKSKKTKQLMTSDYQPDGSYPIISQEASLISGYTDDADYVNHYDCPVIVFGDHTRVLKYVDFDFAVGADGVKILIPNATLNAKFLLNYLTWYKIPNLGYSRHYKLLKDISVPIPPIADQQRIVAELDCLNEMIALKQEQLKEFDKLAQSIFYDMFGDPVTNEKGWNVIELGTKCEVTSFKRVLIEDVVDSGVPFIRGTELMALSKATKGEKIEFTLFITPEHYAQVKAISGVPAVGDLLIPSINSEGNIWILDTDEPRYYKDGRVLWVHVNHDAYTSEALKFIMHILLKKTYSLMATGATFAELKLFVLRELKTILPPLALQQQFAEKIQAIEAQKELVKKSIAEIQQLLDSRMDYFFN